jgi:pimeloyl-ACP methyl ester carboxylesterase
MPDKTRMWDVVIVLPGIGGSVLQKDGIDIWAISGRAISRAMLTMGHLLDELSLSGDDPKVDDLGDGIKATRVMQDVTFIPKLSKIDGYTGLLRMISENFRIRHGHPEDNEPANFFEFPYDWRRDNRSSARKLQQFINNKLHIWRKHTGKQDAKVILLAHSMGGLVSRYYLEMLDGCRDCRLLVTFGTPFHGSLNALDSLTNGVSKALGLMDLSSLIRSCTSTYQLLPTYPVVLVDGVYRRAGEIALPQVDQQRAVEAHEFHGAMNKAATERFTAASAQQNYALLPVIGTEQKTFQSSELRGGQITLSEDLPGWMVDQISNSEVLRTGDGTVPRHSAIPTELSRSLSHSFVPQKHSSLQNMPRVLYELCERLKQSQVQGLENIRGIGGRPDGHPGIQLGLEDVYLTDEPVSMNIQLINPIQNLGKLRIRLQGVDPQRDIVEYEQRECSDQWRLELGELPPGLYRVEAFTQLLGAAAPPPVKDLFEVADTSA